MAPCWNGPNIVCNEVKSKGFLDAEEGNKDALKNRSTVHNTICEPDCTEWRMVGECVKTSMAKWGVSTNDLEEKVRCNTYLH